MIRSFIIHPWDKESFLKGCSVTASLQGYQTMLIYPIAEVMVSHYLALLKAVRIHTHVY